MVKSTTVMFCHSYIIIWIVTYYNNNYITSSICLVTHANVIKERCKKACEFSSAFSGSLHHSIALNGTLNIS